jgi:uncharacterized heparinase superfamily protein
LGGSFGTPIYRTDPIRQDSKFRFLNLTGSVQGVEDWNRSEHARLWLYNLHYFDWLKEKSAIGRVYEDSKWIEQWITENPIGQGVGWEPYPLSLRIVNWIIWLLTIGSGSTSPKTIEILAIQARHLEHSIEYHLLGNHLFANAKALVFAGAFFAGEEGERWLNTGLDLLEREIREQVLADGAHFELSPMYHELILEDVLDLIGLSRVYPGLEPRIARRLKLGDTATAMARWLCHMQQPDGDIPYFNDAAFGIAPPPKDLFAYARQRGCMQEPAANALTLLQPSGYAVFSIPPLFSVFDCGRIGPDYIPGHAHADTLSFELSIGRNRVISNSGTSTYTQGPVREWERSTRAHATVEIDGTNSAETWASFRVGRRPNVSVPQCGGNSIECQHDGYRHLPGNPIHRRRLTATQQSLAIDDFIDGEGMHTARGIFPIHPDIKIECTRDHGLRLETPSGHCLEVRVIGPVTTELMEGSFAAGFGATIPRRVLEWRWEGSLPAAVQTSFRIAR